MEPPIARDKVRYIGEAVAGVAAIDEYVAAEALDLIKVEYEELPAVFDMEETIQPDAPEIHQLERNIAQHFEIARGDVEKGFKEADFIAEGRFVTPPQNHCCMEPKTCIASFDASGKLTIRSTSSHIFSVRRDLSNAFNLPENKVRVIQALTVGGHFGSGIATLQLYYISTLLAMKTGFPVKIENTREEEFLTVRPQMPVSIELKMGIKRDGTVVAKQTKVIGDAGAYRNPTTTSIISVASIRNESLYRFNNIKTDVTLVYTNRVPTGQFRGFGNAQGHFALESMMDMLAEGISMDPAELRLKNAIRTGDISIHGWVMESCGLSECIEKTVKSTSWKEKKVHKKPNKGVGIACCIHVCGMKTAGALFTMAGSAFVHFNADGTVNLITGEGDTGQGAATVLSQICAEELGVPFEDIFISPADTDSTPYGAGPYSSRTTTCGGNAVRLAAADAKRQLLEAAAEKLKVKIEELEIKDRKIYVQNNLQKFISIAQITSDSAFRPILGKGVFIPKQTGSDPVTWYGDCATAYAFGADIVEVEVDTETGQIKVVSITAARDLGKAINPLCAEGQIEGGLAQGIGYALTELLEPTKGEIVKNQFTDYKIPTILDMPEIKPILVESNEPRGPFGAKGFGEIVLVGLGAAIANAIYDAVGVRIKELPITPEKVLIALKEKKA
jgi:CO/xanthine dehydrogenase Mo-binding subunit